MKLIRYGLLLFGLMLGVAAPPALSQNTFQSLGSASLAVTAVTGNVALPAGNSGGTIIVLNVGTKEAFIFFGGSTVTAATTNESVPAGSGRCFSTNQTYIAAITAGADTTTLRISQGSGPCALSYRGAAGTIAGGVDVGTTTVSSGTTTRVLFDNAGVLGEYAISGTGSVCMTTSCSMTTPALGTPSALVLTNATGLPVGGIAGLGTGIATFLGTPSSANLIAAITDETGTGALVFGTSPTIATPILSGAVTQTKITASGTAPGAGNAKFEVVCGTNAGSAKLVMYAGTSGTAVAIVDNVGTGVTGC